jgi:tetratricopeptide (TPR) repeat protein
MTRGPRGIFDDEGEKDDRAGGDFYSEFDVETNDPLDAAFQDQIPTSYESSTGRTPELMPISEGPGVPTVRTVRSREPRASQHAEAMGTDVPDPPGQAQGMLTPPAPRPETTSTHEILGADEMDPGPTPEGSGDELGLEEPPTDPSARAPDDGEYLHDLSDEVDELDEADLLEESPAGVHGTADSAHAPSVLGFDLSPPRLGEEQVVVAPTFDVPVNLTRDEDPEAVEALASQISSRLRSEVRSTRDVAEARPAHAASPEHDDLDPLPFLESLERNPHDRAAFQALHRIYTASSRWEELIGLLLQQTEIAPTQQARMALLREMGRIFNGPLSEPDKAQVVLMSAVLLDPLDDEVAEELTGVTTRAGLWNSLFADLGQSAAQEPNAQRRGILCARLGDWYLQAGHATFAEPCYQQALAANPSEVRAMIGMALVFEQRGEADRVSEVLALLPPAPPPGTAIDLCIRLAGLHERRGNDQGAVAALGEVLVQRPEHQDAEQALEQVLSRQGRWSEVVSLLARRASSIQERDPAEGAALWRRVAGLQTDQLGDVRSAEQTTLHAIELAGPDDEGLERLQRIYLQGSRWQELGWALERRLERAQSSRDKVDLLLQLARLEADEFLQHDAAAERLHAILEIEPRNDEANHRLMEILRRLGRWSELAEIGERYALAVRDEGTKVRLLVEAADLRARELGQPREAASLLRRALQIAPGVPDVLGKLGEALVQAGEPAQALKAFAEQGDAEPDPRARAAAILRAAKLARDELDRKTEAMDLLERAVELDPGCREAVSILREERLTGGDWEGAARALGVEIAQTGSTARRGKLLLQLGEIQRDRLGRRDEAIACFEQARSVLGDSREVARPLFDLYFSAERFHEAAAAGEVLARDAQSDDPRALAEEAMRVAEAYRKAGSPERALSHLERAVAAAPDLESALPELADLYQQVERWTDAFAALTRIQVAGHGAEWVAHQARIGRVARLAGRDDEACQVFEDILSEQPRHNEALRQLAAIAQARGDLARAIELLDRVEVAEEDMRLAHRNRIVDLARLTHEDTLLECAARAVLELEPDDHRCLTLMLDLQSKGEAWSEAVKTIERLAGTVDGGSEARARYYSAAAKVYRDKLDDLEGATRMFEKVLDEDWTNLAVFASLDKLLTEARAYELQERVYRHMIFRVSGKGRPELEAELWHSLGEIYRSRLGRFQEAAEAFAAASKLAPDNLDRQLILAELHQAIDQPQDALARHREILRLDPRRIESLRAIREIHSNAGQYDAAYCICSALVARGAASPEEQKFFEDWLPVHQPLVNAVSPLSDEEWLKHLRHPDEDPYISGIFDSVLAQVLAARVRPTRDFGLGPESLVDVSQPSSVLAQQFVSIVRAFGLRHAPQLHVLRSNPGTMAFAVTNPVASIMGAAMAQLDETQRVFLLARHLAYYQGGRYMAVLCPSRADLQLVLLMAVACVTGNEGAVPPNVRKPLGQLRTTLQRTPHVIERLQRVVQKFLSKGGKADFDRWLKGVELTACRAGTLMVADPRVAAAALRFDTGTLASVPPQERVEDLTTFVASESYALLRRTLGVQVG